MFFYDDDETRSSAGGRAAASRRRFAAFLDQLLVVRCLEEEVEERFRAGELAGFLRACTQPDRVDAVECAYAEEGPAPTARAPSAG